MSPDPHPGSAHGGSQASSFESVPAENPHEKLLLAVLEETISGLTVDESPDPAALQRALAVARRHAGAELEMQPIAIELVGSVLLSVARGDASTGRMVEQITETLWNDPVARSRLEQLWNRLRAMVA